LADVCDGLAARGDKQRFLEVMKDSRVGAIGVTGLVLGLLVKYAALLAVPMDLKRPALLAVPALARFAQLVVLAGSRSARPDGLGNAFLAGLGPNQLLLATATILPLAWLSLQFTGLVAWLVVTLWALLTRWYFTRRLGGISGDIVGCASELAELLALLAVVATTAILTRI
ncbi:MAG: adenosylcobinamide-GDP ribazoletransferase, partial [Geobacter sp.]